MIPYAKYDWRASSFTDCDFALTQIADAMQHPRAQLRKQVIFFHEGKLVLVTWKPQVIDGN